MTRPWIKKTEFATLRTRIAFLFLMAVIPLGARATESDLPTMLSDIKSEIPKNTKPNARARKNNRSVKLEASPKAPTETKMCTVLVPTELGLDRREVPCQDIESI